jgi:hypothetical protein
MWAKIDSGLVEEITDTDPSGRFHPSINWVHSDSPVSVGMAYDGVKFYEVSEQKNSSSRYEVETLRLRAYADPISGSDRYFAEAQRERIMDNYEAAESAKAAGLARFAEIQEQYPWP